MQRAHAVTGSTVTTAPLRDLWVRGVTTGREAEAEAEARGRVGRSGLTCTQRLDQLAHAASGWVVVTTPKRILRRVLFSLTILGDLSGGGVATGRLAWGEVE